MIRRPTLFWRLPDGVDDLLPPDAWRLETLRRRVLDLFRSRGFQYVEPPLIEYADSLLAASGADLELQTLRTVDQRSGRLLGVRADMTSQAARIDAHRLPTDGVQRLCYAGTVVRANPAGVLDTRVPFKAGAEIFGAPDLAADAEVVRLMVETLAACEQDDPVLVVGHMGIFQALVEGLALSEETEATLFAALQRKSSGDIEALLEPSAVRDTLVALPGLMGSPAVLDSAERILAPVPKARGALAALRALVRAIEPALAVELRVDIAELAGYGYHNGPVFSAFHRDYGYAIARGGRYDGIGERFGRARAATGFDVSLHRLIGSADNRQEWIWAPLVADSRARQAAIAALRADGEVVVQALDADETPASACTKVLIRRDGRWQTQPLTHGIPAGSDPTETK